MTQQKRIKRDISGWLILDKPYDMSSTEAVNKLRWLFGAKKAGHAGTLDPLATGILPIAFGEATKTVPFMQDGEKIYRFSLKWGLQTNTDDAEGKVIAESGYRPAQPQVIAALPQFTGTILQKPPAFSAIKIKGERAYDLARAGEDVDIPAREITIDQFRLITHNGDQSEFEVRCQKGTYIRALARDLAQALGTKGHVSQLRRIAVGGFAEEQAIKIGDVEERDGPARDKLLKPVATGLSGLPEIPVDMRQAATIRLGNHVLLTGANAPVALEAAWASLKGEAVAVGYVEKGQFNPKRVILPNM